MTREQFNERITKDYNKIVEQTIKSRLRKDKDFTMDDMTRVAYPLAHYNEIQELVCESECFEITEDEINQVIAEYGEQNLVEMVFDTFLNYRHPEGHNFFEYEELIYFIKDAWGI